MRRTRSATIIEGAADKAVEERARLYRHYQATKRAYREALYKEHALGLELRGFATQLTRYTLSDAAAMLSYVRETARGWLSVAPPEIRSEALSLVNEHIIRIRVRAGLQPFDDPLPDESDDMFQACKRELAP